MVFYRPHSSGMSLAWPAGAKLQSLSRGVGDVLVPFRDFLLMYPSVNFALILNTNSRGPFSHLLELTVGLKTVVDRSVQDCLGSWKEDVTDSQTRWQPRCIALHIGCLSDVEQGQELLLSA